MSNIITDKDLQAELTRREKNPFYLPRDACTHVHLVIFEKAAQLIDVIFLVFIRI